MQGIRIRRNIAILFVVALFISGLQARTDRYRCMWRENPATSMVIGWDQMSGADPVFYYDSRDGGQNVNAYRKWKRPDRIVEARGMNNYFVRLTGLTPNTVYFFVIKDSEGVSRRLSFQTAPDDPSERLSILAGGDSRNHRDGRLNANRMVSRLRPDFILFGGDFTGGDTAEEWQHWMDDWQATIGSDGRLFPIVVARGNHEYSNGTLLELFDAPTPGLYYGFTFGGNLLRVYTLNSLIPAGGDQKAWLETDLRANRSVNWRIAQYHHPIRPHTQKKAENDDLFHNWAPLFYEEEVKLVIECDAHVVKVTWPIRPSFEPGSHEGFIRDDAEGTVFIGEGGWGAPIRPNNDDKPWTRNSDSFNQLKWIFVDQEKIEVRTVRTDGSEGVREVDFNNVFEPPLGLVLWSPSNGPVITIPGKNAVGLSPVAATTATPATPEETQPVLSDFFAHSNISGILLRWSTQNDGGTNHFELQRSVDGGRKYSTIGMKKALGGSRNIYEFTDTGNGGLTPNISYRIKWVLDDGTFTFYNAKIPAAATSSSSPAASASKLMPNQVTGDLQFVYQLPSVCDVTLRILSSSHQQVYRMVYPGQSPGRYLQTVNIKQIPKGDYRLLIEAGGNMLQEYQVLKRF